MILLQDRDYVFGSAEAELYDWREAEGRRKLGDLLTVLEQDVGFFGLLSINNFEPLV